MRILINNRIDLTFLIFLKLCFCYFAYIFFTNALNMDIFKYPDMEAYKDCIGTGEIMVNVLYSELLCTFGLNNQDAISSVELILLACSINIFGICSKKSVASFTLMLRISLIDFPLYFISKVSRLNLLAIHDSHST